MNSINLFIKKSFIIYLTLISILSLCIFYPIKTLSYFSYSSFVWDEDYTIETSISESEYTDDHSNPLGLESESCILIEQSTGQILYSYNSHEQLRPASVTKIMTILLIMEALDSGEITLDTQIPCSENARNMGGSQIWLDETETLTVDEMLKAICVVSANDCTVAMAEYLAGSEEIFVQKMNEKAKSLGMNDTTFKNCHGIDEDGHVTSSYDISLMSRELLTKHPDITNYTTIWMDSLRDGKSELVNTNKLIRTYDGITGLKTGSTSLALYNLSASATRGDLSLIAVVLRSPTPKIRFSEAKLLLDYGFSNYEFVKLKNKNDIFQTLDVSKGISNSVDIIYENDVGYLKEKRNNDQISEELNIASTLEAPINQGQLIGSISYKINNEEIANVNLIASNSVEKISLLNLFKKNTYSWFTIFK